MEVFKAILSFCGSLICEPCDLCLVLIFFSYLNILRPEVAIGIVVLQDSDAHSLCHTGVKCYTWGNFHPIHHRLIPVANVEIAYMEN